MKNAKLNIFKNASSMGRGELCSKTEKGIDILRLFDLVSKPKRKNGDPAKIESP